MVCPRFGAKPLPKPPMTYCPLNTTKNFFVEYKHSLVNFAIENVVSMSTILWKPKFVNLLSTHRVSSDEVIIIHI